MPQDLRNRPTIDHRDIISLNFIQSSPPYHFRRHFRQGLRSHIMEILNASDVEREREGVLVEGVRYFPKALPRRMLRIFRTRLATLDVALEETSRVKLVERYLGAEYMARSTECIVNYEGPDGRQIVLCGFQEYIAGEVFDPWTILDSMGLLPMLYHALCQSKEPPALTQAQWIETLQAHGANFITRIKQMITEAGHIPDLAGAGNLIVTLNGEIRLVDINNISPVVFEPTVRLDEKGYPVGDKSVEALSLIEEKLLSRPVDLHDPVYRHFLDPQRKERVKAEERRFREAILKSINGRRPSH